MEITQVCVDIVLPPFLEHMRPIGAYEGDQRIAVHLVDLAQA